uniref:Uncharacterized protein n=1 Tax=Oryza sativa subsp. japonica TaxID=39947 RepID=Q6K5Y5_ORYSJ|nr:hypothetical protein [Oryza sativa Japonica Group]
MAQRRMAHIERERCLISIQIERERERVGAAAQRWPAGVERRRQRPAGVFVNFFF